MTNPRPAVERAGPTGAKTPTRRVVSPSEAQRSAARGRQGIGALHSTDEAGEPSPRGAGGEATIPFLRFPAKVLAHGFFPSLLCFLLTIGSWSRNVHAKAR